MGREDDTFLSFVPNYCVVRRLCWGSGHFFSSRVVVGVSSSADGPLIKPHNKFQAHLRIFPRMCPTRVEVHLAKTTNFLSGCSPGTCPLSLARKCILVAGVRTQQMSKTTCSWPQPSTCYFFVHDFERYIPPRPKGWGIYPGVRRYTLLSPVRHRRIF